MGRKLFKDPKSGLFLSEQHIEEKEKIKRAIDRVVQEAISAPEVAHLQDTYYLSVHALFDSEDKSVFTIDVPRATLKLPRFRSNTMVFWVNPTKGIVDLLWMVAPKKEGKKLKVEFNKTGAAYLQAKGAMAS
jgi:hypothetical protein